MSDDRNAWTVKDWAAFYIAQGEHVVPVPAGQKGPKITRWQITGFSPDDFEPGMNIGLRGDVDRGMLDFDIPLDAFPEKERFERGQAAARVLGIDTKLSRGRKSYTAHFRSTTTLASKDFGRIHVQLLAKGNRGPKQSIVAPSVADNVKRVWEGTSTQDEWSLPTIDGQALIRMLDVANVLALMWKGGGARHNMAIGWKMFVLDHGLDEEFGKQVLLILGSLLPMEDGATPLTDHLDAYKRITKDDAAHKLTSYVYDALCKAFSIKKKSKRQQDGMVGDDLSVLPVPAAVTVPPDELWKTMDDWFDRWVWYRPEYKLLDKLWVASTYIKPKLNAFYHNLPYGQTVGGKSQNLKTIYLLSYQGYYTVALKPAGLFRTIQKHPEITFFFEELSFPKSMGEDDKGILELLLAMIDRGKHVIRIEEIDGIREPREFRIFGGAGFSSKRLDSLRYAHEDIVNRSISKAMFTAPVEHARPMLDAVDTPEAQGIRAMLVGMRERLLNDWPVVVEPKTFGRAYRYKDMYMMLAPVASYFGVLSDLERALKTIMGEQAEYARESWHGQVIAATWQAFEQMPSIAGTFLPPTLDLVLKNLPKETTNYRGEKRPVTKHSLRTTFRLYGIKTAEDRHWMPPAEEGKGEGRMVRATIISTPYDEMKAISAQFGLSTDPSDPTDPSLAVTSDIISTQTDQPTTLARPARVELTPLDTAKEGSVGSEGSVNPPPESCKAPDGSPSHDGYPCKRCGKQ